MFRRNENIILNCIYVRTPVILCPKDFHFMPDDYHFMPEPTPIKPRFQTGTASIFLVLLPVIMHDDALVVHDGFEMHGATPERMDVFESLARVARV